MKKILICFGIITAFILNGLVETTARDDPFIRQVWEVFDHTSLYTEYPDGDYRIGERIPDYLLMADKFTENDEYDIYPVYRDRKLAGLIFRYQDGSFSIGAYYAPALNDIIDISRSFAIVKAMNGVYAYQDKVMRSVTWISQTGPSVEIMINPQGVQNDFGTTLNVPGKAMQHGYDCWAAGMAAVIQYQGTYADAAAVINRTGHDAAATLSQVSGFLNTYYDIDHAAYGYQLGFNTALSNIGNNRPILAFCYNNSGGAGHLVVIKGMYYVTSGTKHALYRLMDPYCSGSNVDVLTTTDAVLTFQSYGGNTYTWNKSIVIY